MKKTILFTLSIFLIAGMGFAKNVKTYDNSKDPKHYGEMMIKIDNQYSQKDSEKLKKELEEAKQQKTAKAPMVKYPQFAGTIAEEYIKTELAKNSNWEIKGVSYNGTQKKFVMEPSTGGYYKDIFSYTFTTTSGKKVLTCEYEWEKDKMSSAVSVWASDIMKAKYPEFIGTDAQKDIKNALSKNVDWQIKDIIFLGPKKKTIIMPSEGSGYETKVYLYKFITNSGTMDITCKHKEDSNKMQAAIKVWKNKK